MVRSEGDTQLNCSLCGWGAEKERGEEGRGEKGGEGEGRREGKEKVRGTVLVTAVVRVQLTRFYSALEWNAVKRWLSTVVHSSLCKRQNSYIEVT